MMQDWPLLSLTTFPAAGGGGLHPHHPRRGGGGGAARVVETFPELPTNLAALTLERT